MVLPYDATTGTISFQGQALHDPTIDMLVVSSSYLHHWLMGASSSPRSSIALTFTWDEDLQQAVAKGTELADGKVDSFYGIAYGEDLNTPLVDSKGNLIMPIAIENIQYIKKQP